MSSWSMNKRTRFVLTLLTLVLIISGTIFAISKLKIGADTVQNSEYRAMGSKDQMTKMVETYTKRTNTYNNWLSSGQISEKTATRVKLELAKRKVVNEKALIAKYKDLLPADKVSEYQKDISAFEKSQVTVNPTYDLAESASPDEMKISIVKSNLILPSPNRISTPSKEATANLPDQSYIIDEIKRQEINKAFNEAKESAIDVYKSDSNNDNRISKVFQAFYQSPLSSFVNDSGLSAPVQDRLKSLLADDDKLFSFLPTSDATCEILLDYHLGLTTKQSTANNKPLWDGSIDTELEKFFKDIDPFSSSELGEISESNSANFGGIVEATNGDPGILNFYHGDLADGPSNITVVSDVAAGLANGDPDKYLAMTELLPGMESQMQYDNLAANSQDLTKNAKIYEELIKSDTLKNVFKSSISINPNTGHVEYTSILKKKNDQGGYDTVGYVSFDPTSNSFDAEIPIELGSKNLTLFSDPRTGDVWVELGNADSSPLLGEGKVGLVSVTVSKAGKIGGQFRLFNRLFAYNPNSGAFEMPIKLSSRAQITIDTKGNVRGNVGIFGDSNSSTQGSLFFDRTGNMGITLDLRTVNSQEFGRISTASIMYSKDGGIAGTVDMGKVIGGSNASSFFLSFDKSGITGVNLPFGSWAGKPFGLGISTNGSLSLGGFVPIAGIPVPVGITQDSKGGFRLAWPGGSLGIIKGDDRPQNPPELKVDEKTGFYDASCVYYRHSFKKLFQTVRVYQVPCETIDRAEQIERGDMIIKVYSELLGRNPSIGEFLNWYFYSGHELYAYPDHNKKDYRMKTTEAAVRRVIKSGPYKNMSAQFKFPNKEEYNWIKAGKDPLQYPKRPKETLTKNIFADGSLNLNDKKYMDATMADLVKAIENSAKGDDGKIVDQTGTITDVGEITPLVDDESTTNTTTSNGSTTTSTDNTAANNGTTSTSNQSSITSSSNSSNQTTAHSNTSIEAKIADQGKQMDEIKTTNAHSKSRVETVKTSTAELNKIAQALDQAQLAEKTVEITKQQVEAEKQTIPLLNDLENQSKISSFLIGARSNTIDELNKAQINNRVRNKALNQISAKVTKISTAENVYAQNRAIEFTNQDLQKTIDKKQAQFSLFGWAIKLYKNIFN